MIENEERGSYGAYSSAGKTSVEIFANIRRKDIILNPQNSKKNKISIINFLKRNGYHNIYGDQQNYKKGRNDDLDESQIEEVEEEIDIFKKEATRNRNKKTTDNKKKKKKNENEPNYFHRTDKESYKFHDLHRQKGILIRPDTTPTCTKYLPNKNLVWRRTINWPSWDKMKSRKPFGEEVKDTKFYINHGEILSQVGPCLIDMEKQTMRGDVIPEGNNLRIITTRPFTPTNRSHNFFLKSNKKQKEIILNESNNKIVFRKDNNWKTNKKNGELAEKRYNDDVFYENKKTNEEINPKWVSPSKRGVSAVSTSTRPQTANPKNMIFYSRPTTSSQNVASTSTKNRVDNINDGIVGSHITSRSLLDEEEGEEKKENDINTNRENEEENSFSNDSSDLNDSYLRFKKIYQRQIKKRNLTDRGGTNYNKPLDKKILKNVLGNKKLKLKSKTYSSFNSLSKKNSKPYGKRKIIHKKTIKGPDFKKIISREYFNNLDDRGTTLIPFSLPNFKLVRERPLTMVTYERPFYNKRKINYLKGIEPSFYNDQYKYIEFINNYQRCIPPNLDKMMARPKDDGSPLPVYMKGCVSRDACNIMTDISLKMNNFANGKFLSNYTSFWPKKSFNKIINLNILNSDTFISNLVSDKKKLKSDANYIAKSIRFYNKNYKDLMKEGLLTRFDNITLKTIRPNSKIDPKDLEKFLKNYENKKGEDFI